MHDLVENSTADTPLEESTADTPLEESTAGEVSAGDLTTNVSIK